MNWIASFLTHLSCSLLSPFFQILLFIFYLGMVFLMEAHGTNQVLGPASSEFGVWFVGSTFIGSFCCALQYAHICSWGVN